MMTFEEFSKLKSKIHLEIDEYKKEMLEKSKSEIYDSCNEINTIETIYQYLLNKGRFYEYKYMPKQNILTHYYTKFKEMGYKTLDNENIDDTIGFDIHRRKRQQQEEM